MSFVKRGCTAFAAVSIVMFVVQCGGTPEPDGGADLASVAVAIDGWQIDGEPELYVGDALYQLINGGAELYHRFGFVAALAAQYSNADGRSMSLEVFEMGDVDGARSIYVEKTGDTGEPLAIGDEGVGEDYYLNVRSGRYLVTITGFDSDAETQAGILALARAVAARLGGMR